MKLGGRCMVQKSRPNSNLGVIAPWVHTPSPTNNVSLNYDVGKISAGRLAYISRRLVRRLNKVLRCILDRSTCKNWQRADACRTLCRDHNPVVPDTSWCRSSPTLMYHSSWSTSLARRMSTRDSGPHAARRPRRASARVFHCIQLLPSLKIFNIRSFGEYLQNYLGRGSQMYSRGCCAPFMPVAAKNSYPCSTFNFNRK